jgi:hypothetical protein
MKGKSITVNRKLGENFNTFTVSMKDKGLVLGLGTRSTTYRGKQVHIVSSDGRSITLRLITNDPTEHIPLFDTIIKRTRHDR